MNPQREIQNILETCHYAVMATQHEGQPHASLMAFASMDGLRHLIMATYRETLKYRSLSKDGRVAILIDDRGAAGSPRPSHMVLTAHGIALEVPGSDREAVVRTYLQRHPDLEAFLASPDCALLRVAVQAYEVVLGTDDVLWHRVEDLANT